MDVCLSFVALKLPYFLKMTVCFKAYLPKQLTGEGRVVARSLYAASVLPAAASAGVEIVRNRN